MLLMRLPRMFKQEFSGVGATLEKRWKFCAFEGIKRTWPQMGTELCREKTSRGRAVQGLAGVWKGDSSDRPPSFQSAFSPVLVAFVMSCCENVVVRRLSKRKEKNNLLQRDRSVSYENSRKELQRYYFYKICSIEDELTEQARRIPSC